jgi:hypothetical protein
MKQSPILPLIALILSLSACEKEIAFNGNETEPQLTLNGLLTPASAIAIQLTESHFFLSNAAEFKNIQNATVELWKDDEPIEVIPETANGYYTASYRPAIGDKLRITASAPGLNPVECATEILPAPLIRSVEATPLTGESSEYNLHVRLQDPAETTDYYRIDLYFLIYDEKNGLWYKSATFYSLNDRVFDSTSSPSFGERSNVFSIFSDELFNGKEYQLELQVSDLYPDERKSLNVEIQHITKDYYLHLKSRSTARTDGDGGQLFTEPVQIYGNIRGGLGLLGSYTSATHQLPLF